MKHGKLRPVGSGVTGAVWDNATMSLATTWALPVWEFNKWPDHMLAVGPSHLEEALLDFPLMAALLRDDDAIRQCVPWLSRYMEERRAEYSMFGELI